MELEESDPHQVKSIVNPTDYSKVKVGEGKAFYLGNTLDEKERRSYVSYFRTFPMSLPRHHQT